MLIRVRLKLQEPTGIIVHKLCKISLISFQTRYNNILVIFRNRAYYIITGEVRFIYSENFQR